MITRPKLIQFLLLVFFINYTSTCISQCDFELIAPSPISCQNECTGILEVNVLSGSSPFTYTWSNGETTSTIDSLCPGMYSVIIVDNIGCSWIDSIQIDSSTFENSYSISGNLNSSCSISVEALTSGSAPFTYSWSNGSTANIAENLCDGQYTVDIQDTLGCNYSDSISISNSTLLATTHPYASVPAGGVCGEYQCNGKFAILINAGTPPYNISVSNGFTHTTYHNYYVIDSLCPGQYQYTITDSNGQSVINNAVIDQTQGVTLNSQSVDTLQEITCSGAQTGKVVVHPQYGTPPYSFSLNSGPNQSGNVFSNLSAGIHSILVIDSLGCADTINVALSQPAAPTINVAENATCNGECDGQISVSVVGGVPPYSYSNDNGITYQSNNTFSNLCSDNYGLVIKDANDCLYNSSATVNDYPALSTSPTTTSSSCHGISDASINMNTTGGSPTYLYSINGSAPSSTHPINNISAGDYNIVTTDANGCSVEDTITVPEPPAFNFISIANNPSTCGTNDGEFEIAATNGVAPYIYSITGPTGTFQTTGYFNNLYAGIYVVYAIDANGCVDSTIVTISDNIMDGFVDTLVHPTCFDSCNGWVLVDQYFGQTPITYTLYETGFSQVSVNYFGDLCPGTHYVTLVDDGLCVEIVQFEVLETDPIVFDPQVTDISCPSLSDGDLSVVNVVGGDGGPYNYSITNDSTNFTSSNTFSGLPLGTDTVWVKDGNECLGKSPFTINEPPPLDIFINAQNLNCNGDNSGFINIIINGGGTPPYSINFNGTTSPTTTYSGLSAGTYNISVIDANLCSFDTTVILSEPPPLLISIDSTENVNCNGVAVGKVYSSSTGGTLPHLYSYNGGVTYQSQPTIGGLYAGVYDISVQDSNGCTDIVNSISITEPSAMVIDTSNLLNAYCDGVCDGSVMLDISNADSPFTILSPSDSIHWMSMSSYELMSICSGVYSIDVYDNNGCTSNTTIDIGTNFELLLDTVSISDPLCSDNCDGAIQFEVLNGVNPYTITNNLGQLSPLSNNQFMIDSLCGGNLLIEVVDSVGCMNNIAVTIDSPDSLYFNYTQTDSASCTSCSDGVAEVSIVGGTAPYTVDWTDFSSSQTGSQATDLAGGTGIVCVTDTNGCQFCDSVTVNYVDDVGVRLNKLIFKVIPNPANDVILIKSSIKLDVIEIRDVQGKLVKKIKGQYTDYEVTIDDLESGMYVITVHSSGQTEQSKLVVH